MHGDTLLSAARSQDGRVRTHNLPISLTDAVLQQNGSVSPPISQRRRGSSSSKNSSLSMSPPLSSTLQRGASTRRTSDARREAGGSRIRRGSAASQTAAAPTVVRTHSSGGSQTSSESAATRNCRGSEARPMELRNPAEEPDQGVSCRPKASETRFTKRSAAVSGPEPAAHAEVSAMSREARLSRTSPKAVVAPASMHAPVTSESHLHHEQAKGRADRIAKLKASDVASSTEDLRADLSTARYAMHLFMNSRMHEAYNLVSERSETRLYYAVAFALLSTMKAMMTFEAQDLSTAISHCKDALHIASLLRRKSSMISSLGRFVRGAGPSVTWVATMTPVQQHAELVTAECTLLKAMLSIVHSGDLFGFLSEALHLRTAYGTYHSLLKYVEWEQQHGPGTSGATHSDNDFRSGVYLGSGCISLILGLLPSKVLKFMEVFGYNGNVKEGLKLLSMAGRWSADPTEKEPGESVETEGVRRVLCDMSMLMYHLVISTFIPVPGVDISFAEKVLDYHLERYPQGVFFLYFHGRLYSTQGLSKDAIVCFEDARDIQEEYVQLKHICYWDMALCSLSLGAWQDTYQDFSVLAEENNWSKAVYNYARAAALYQSGDEASRERACEMFARVPSLTQKIAGKSIPLEKYVARKARKMIEQGYLVLPAMEFAYICHCYTTASERALTSTLLPIVDAKLQELQGSDSIDDLCLVHFLRGVILRNVAYPEVHVRSSGKRSISRTEAERASEASLSFVVDHGKELMYDHYLMYFAHYELGRLYISAGRHAEARAELDLVLSGKNLGDHGRKGKYSMQNMAVLRSHGALEVLDHT